MRIHISRSCHVAACRVGFPGWIPCHIALGQFAACDLAGLCICMPFAAQFDDAFIVGRLDAPHQRIGWLIGLFGMGVQSVPVVGVGLMRIHIRAWLIVLSSRISKLGCCPSCVRSPSVDVYVMRTSSGRLITESFRFRNSDPFSWSLIAGFWLLQSVGCCHAYIGHG